MNEKTVSVDHTGKKYLVNICFCLTLNHFFQKVILKGDWTLGCVPVQLEIFLVSFIFLRS